MGILYLDEAGNTGLWDNSQTKLIYGGPYVKSSDWKEINDELVLILRKYKGLILGRFNTGINASTQFSSLENGVKFLSDFRIHAADIIDRKRLWSKLSDVEKYQVLEEVVDALIKKHIPFYVGIVDKEKLRPAIKPANKQNNMTEYKTLLPAFFHYVEGHLGDNEEFTVIIDDGDAPEKEQLRIALRDNNLKKAMGELIVEKSINFPLLQAADVGVWITQAFTRLDSARTDPHAVKIRDLHSKLLSIKKELII
ncbi:DUF3800 domain-containing protein [Neobacillus niacini]|uniref:DUF3800 domain-containing protein n=1 Tax=Neobacillus niacini TaxID=86668 RepID=UPI003B0103F6